MLVINWMAYMKLAPTLAKAVLQSRSHMHQPHIERCFVLQEFSNSATDFVILPFLGPDEAVHLAGCQNCRLLPPDWLVFVQIVP